MSSESPRKWQFTWEAQSNAPNLKLFLFDSHTKPSIHCNGIRVELVPERSRLHVSWTTEAAVKVSLWVPIPRVLIDTDSPVSFRALDDHIEVKLLLLLPVDHPLLSGFDSVLNISDTGESNEVLDSNKPLVMGFDLKALSSMEEEGVHFFCRNCSTRLTTSPLRHFVEMPSVNWREMADNWFGACCCSFGGISEKLVNRYVDAYTCSKGLCMLDSSTITLCKDDLVGCKFGDMVGNQVNEVKQDYAVNVEDSHDSISIPAAETSCDNHERIDCFNGRIMSKNLKSGVMEEETCGNELFGELSASEISENVASRNGCCGTTCHTQVLASDFCTYDLSGSCLVDQKVAKTTEVMKSQRFFLNGLLGDVFMARSYNVSADIDWKKFVCSQCSSLLGTYPCAKGYVPVDAGIRLFKCYLSTSLPVGGSSDIFRKYTLEKMFANHLVEFAHDELSFRTVVRDLTTKSPMLQVVLINPNSWCCTGNISETESGMEQVSNLDLHPAIKILFCDYGSTTQSEPRVLEDWVTKNKPDEAFMLACQIEELVESMRSGKDFFPPSCAFFQHFSVLTMPR
ncbi:hypothetical protein K2173_021445 [Erythroxylum novogranatense]|uniref:Ubiquitin-conjugating enzyme E2C-binding protein n=1 Tax=Erythroxylum novogranatense TaxID=1862640 RepID=A0AAV8TXE7_9ROSI|nr:hypothetical protein K2173_021445 [Erythroxylum novogranatense]